MYFDKNLNQLFLQIYIHYSYRFTFYIYIWSNLNKFFRNPFTHKLALTEQRVGEWLHEHEYCNTLVVNEPIYSSPNKFV